MPIERLVKFAQAGLNTDLIPWVLPGDFLTSMSNVRLYNNAIHPFGGYSEMFSFPDGVIPGSVLHNPSQTSKYWIAMCNNHVYKFAGSLVDVSPVGMTQVNQDAYTGALISDIPIINTQALTPHYLLETSSNFIPLPFNKTQTWKQANQACKVIRSHKQWLFALGIIDNGVEKEAAVRWSSPADVGAVPESWDHLDKTTYAGYTTLGGSGGPVIDGLTMRDSFVVYRESGISIFDYVGGNYVWRIRHLSSSVGILSQDCVVDVSGTHYFISDGDIYRNDGNAITSIIHNRIKKQFKDSISATAYKKSYAIHNPSVSEIWFCIPTTGNDHASIAYIYNYRDDSWAVRDLPNTIKSAYGFAPKAGLEWDQLKGSWDGTNIPWSGNQSTPFDNTVVSIIPANGSEPAKIISVDTPLGLNIQQFSSKIERIGFTIEGVDQNTTIQRIFPHISGTAKVFIQVGSQQSPGAPTVWKPAIQFDPTKSRKVDVRTTGELHCFRIFMDNVDAYFSISGIDIEYVEAGKR